MLDQIEKTWARSGCLTQAQQMLRNCKRIDDNMQAGRQQRQGSSKGGPMRQQMRQSSAILMLSATKQVDGRTMRAGPGSARTSQAKVADRQQQGQQQPGQGEGSGPTGQATNRLKICRRTEPQPAKQCATGLGQLQTRPGRPWHSSRRKFGEAGEAMRRCRRKLTGGEQVQAAGDQGRACRRSGKAPKDMMNQMICRQWVTAGAKPKGQGPDRNGQQIR